MKPRILLAGLFHETHTFLEVATCLGDFSILRGQELLHAAPGGSPLRSAIDAGQRCGWQFIPTVDYRAQPSGMVADEVFERFWSEFCQYAEEPLQAGIDAIYLVLHGAMVTPTHDDVEGEFL
ncbi:MAG TPA: M81 family metallopeptidase, partial [Pirellulaceae bacterium]|nr:M81 family metallopeptidase [Pirellulaceae bacterium]